MSKTLFISDSHFFHGNIIKYCNRPFSSVDEMNSALVKNWNNTVSNEDRVYHLGDFSFAHGNRFPATKNIYDQLNGYKILISGNHDDDDTKFMFNEFHDYLEVSVNNHFVVMCHYPLLSFNRMHKGAVHFYGHVHNQTPLHAPTNSYNICVEMQDYRPKSLFEIIGKT